MLTRSVVQRSFSTPLYSRGLATTLLARPKEQWTLNELKGEAKRRGLASSGNKAALIGRLTEDESSHLTARASSGASPNAAAQPRFLSTRTISSSAVRSATEVQESKFSPRRAAPLDVKIPDLSYEPPETGPTIPYVPDNWGSSAAQSASPPPPEPSSTPKMVTIASGNTHIGGGPSHPSAALAGPAENTPQWQILSSTLSHKVSRLYSSLSPPPSGSSGKEPEYDAKTELNSEEKRGLYVLAGLLAGGYLLGGVGTGSKEEPKEKHH